ncbi:MAG: alpha/beta hydrolase-fold protein [Polyangiaceae bacterium]
MIAPSKEPLALYVDPSLPRHIFGWKSSKLGLDMSIVRYGDRGHPLLIFPTAAADFLENERFYLIKSVEPFMFDGRVQVFSVDSINRYSWMTEDVPVVEQAAVKPCSREYIENEVVPFIRTTTSDPDARIGVTGASFGAFHAANQFFRRPDLFDTLVAMSGFYDLAPGYTGGYTDDNVYFNNPVAYLSNLSDPKTLSLLREECQIHILSGRGEWEAPHRSVQLSDVLHAKGIPHNLDLWGYDVNHDWPWWRKMLPHYIDQRLGW